MAIRSPLPPLEDIERGVAPPAPEPDAIAMTPPRGARPERARIRRVRRERPSWPGALAVAFPDAVTACGAAVPAMVEPLRRPGALPFVIIALVLLHVGGYALSRALGLEVWRRIWLVNLLVGAALVPALTVQSTLLRMPYVSLERGSAGPAILASIAVAAVMLLIVGVVAASAWTAPEDASLLFLPVALVVPIVLGLPTDRSELRALQALALSFGLAALMTALAHLFPRGSRSLFGPIGMAIVLVVLTAIDRGPAYHATSVGVASLTTRLFLGAAILFLAAVPLLALWTRQAVRHAQRTVPRSTRS